MTEAEIQVFFWDPGSRVRGTVAACKSGKLVFPDKYDKIKVVTVSTTICLIIVVQISKKSDHNVELQNPTFISEL